jgi:heme/copper-type cytochrome/quinol oxidase subunit 4
MPGRHRSGLRRQRVAPDFAVAARRAVHAVVPALAQTSVHLVYFLHLGGGTDDTNNLPLAFGKPIVLLVIASHRR